MTDDRRRFTRIGFDAPAWVVRGAEPRQSVTVVDLSFKGALFRSDDAAGFSSGDRCELLVTLGDEDAQIRMTGDVRHIDGSLVGLACVDLDLDSITHLRRLITLNLGDPALAERDLKALIAG